MQFSHSRVELFKNCPYQFKLRYIDKLKTLPKDEATNALFLGAALHTGIEKDAETAILEYFNQYPIITNEHIDESIKLDYMIPKVKKLLPTGIFEQQILTSDFNGFMDLLVKVDEIKRRRSMIPVYDLYDFKYSNNIDNYKESGQLHEYKYFFELQNKGIIRDMYFVMVPKVQIKQKETESLITFRKRILSELETKEIQLLKIDYQPEKVIEFMLTIKKILEAESFNKNPTYLCNWCDYQKFCEKGETYMILPKNERRNIQSINKKTLWLYGAPFTGKTTFANSFPDPLMLNTDGNIKFVDAPFIALKNNVTVDGRLTKTTLAWEVFKDTISELEKKQNDFKTIIVDLLEDTYEYCRLWCYDKMGIEHESDNSFKAWDYVRTEFLSTLKRLMNLDYENIILISHEDTSKDITKKMGDRITAIKPNIQDKTANKVAGMVDIVARVVAEGDVRTLNFKSNEVIFGGGRLKVKHTEIDLDYAALLAEYQTVDLKKAERPVQKEQEKKEEPVKQEESEPAPPEPENQTDDTQEEPETEEQPKTRTRRTRKNREE